MRTHLIALAALLVLSDIGHRVGPEQAMPPRSARNTARIAPDGRRRSSSRRRSTGRREWRVASVPGGQGDYKPFDELFNLPDMPEGFRVQLHTDGTTYTFSVKDTRDPCGYAVFSDQSLDIYEAVPSSRQVRSRLLTQE